MSVTSLYVESPPYKLMVRSESDTPRGAGQSRPGSVNVISIIGGSVAYNAHMLVHVVLVVR